MPARLIRFSFFFALLTAAAPVAAQVDSIELELDQFWAEVSRTVAEGDFEGMQATYHPDAILVFEGRDSDSYRTRIMTTSLGPSEAGTADTREGRKVVGVEFRFSSRVHDSNTAHEVGISHFRRTRQGGEREDFYGLVDSYLVKKDGRWMILVEIQRVEATEAEWDALQ